MKKFFVTFAVLGGMLSASASEFDRNEDQRRPLLPYSTSDLEVGQALGYTSPRQINYIDISEKKIINPVLYVGTGIALVGIIGLISNAATLFDPTIHPLMSLGGSALTTEIGLWIVALGFMLKGVNRWSDAVITAIKNHRRKQALKIIIN